MRFRLKSMWHTIKIIPECWWGTFPFQIKHVLLAVAQSRIAESPWCTFVDESRDQCDCLAWSTNTPWSETEMVYRFSDISDIGKYRLFSKCRISVDREQLKISDIGWSQILDIGCRLEINRYAIPDQKLFHQGEDAEAEERSHLQTSDYNIRVHSTLLRMCDTFHWSSAYI